MLSPHAFSLLDAVSLLLLYVANLLVSVAIAAIVVIGVGGVYAAVQS